MATHPPILQAVDAEASRDGLHIAIELLTHCDKRFVFRLSDMQALLLGEQLARAVRQTPRIPSTLNAHPSTLPR